MSVRLVVFWDVDGTLLTTARAGIESLEDAVERVTGVRVDLDSLETAGLTDFAIVQRILLSIDRRADDGIVDALLRVHEEQLAGYLGRRTGHVLPGVREILEDLSRGDAVRSLLLTGNTELGARAKLRHYGLAEFFLEGGAFCAGAEDRTAIARRARALVEETAATYVVGDTPHDIEAGDAIGARTIAVATGAHASSELEAHRPWAVLERLPDPAAFRRLLELE